MFLLPNAKDAAAAVVYEQGPAGPTISRLGLPSVGDIQSFDDFIIPNAATVGSVRWKGLARPANNRFRIGFYDNEAPSGFGFPAATPFFETIVTPDITPDADFPRNWSDYSADLGNLVSFDGFTRYWISIYDLSDSHRWTWGGDRRGVAVSRLSSGMVLQQITAYFTLDSDGGGADVPAPAGLPLFAVGILGLILSRRRRHA